MWINAIVNTKFVYKVSIEFMWEQESGAICAESLILCWNP